MAKRWSSPTFTTAHPSFEAAAKDFLTKMGVEVLVGVKVENYDGDTITFEGGKSIRTKNVIWSAGVMGVIPDGMEKDIAKSFKVRYGE